MPLYRLASENKYPAVVYAAYDYVLANAQKLKAAGVSTVYSSYKGQIHQLLVYRGRLTEEANPIDEIGKRIHNLWGKS